MLLGVCGKGGMHDKGSMHGGVVHGRGCDGGMHGRGCAWQGGHMWQGACMAGGACMGGGMHGRGGMHGGMHNRGHMWQGACMASRACLSLRVCVVRCVWPRCACMAGDKTSAADSTYPTGMHSCLIGKPHLAIIANNAKHLFTYPKTFLAGVRTGISW